MYVVQTSFVLFLPNLTLAMEGVDRKWLRKSKIEFNVQQQEVKGTGHAFRVPSFSQFFVIKQKRFSN
uniref:Secreted protein n=1 Tax=Anguilla anguilla TaxID=7936 RepID=A0A0E9WXW7_ANGAN